MKNLKINETLKSTSYKEADEYIKNLFEQIEDVVNDNINFSIKTNISWKFLLDNWFSYHDNNYHEYNCFVLSKIMLNNWKIYLWFYKSQEDQEIDCDDELEIINRQFQIEAIDDIDLFVEALENFVDKYNKLVDKYNEKIKNDVSILNKINIDKI